MALEEGDFQPVDLPDDFVVPKPEKAKPFTRPRKAVGDKAEAPPKRVARKVTVPNKKGQFVGPLTTLYMGVGGFLMHFDPVCANAVIQSAEPCAILWDELAYQNEAVRRFLWSLTQVSLGSKLFLAHMPIFMAVFMHHVPAAQRMMGKMGEQFAETIANQMNANEKPDES